MVGVGDGKFHFRIEHPAKQIGPGKLSLAKDVPGGTQQFRSRPDLTPTAVAVATDSAPQADGDIFVAPQNGPTQDGPMILDPKGRLVWFHATPVDQQLLTTDFRVSKLHGRKVLTWWQGDTNRGSGRGVGVIYNRRYRRVATVHAGNGLEADLHEFMVTNKGDAWMIAASPVSLPGLGRPVIDSVVQEIDIKTGLVLFEWHALDHVASVGVLQVHGQPTGARRRSVPRELDLARPRRQRDRLDAQHLGDLQARPPDRPDHLAPRRQAVELQDGPGNDHGLPALGHGASGRDTDDLRQRRRPAQGPSVLARDPRSR